MMFDKDDLLNYEEIECLLKEESPNERALIICNKLKKYCFYQNGFLYKYNSKYVIYKQIENIQDDELNTIITDYLSCSKLNLSKEQYKIIKLENKSFVSLCENSTIKKINSQLKVYLAVDDNIFTGDFYEVHFRNGFLNIKTMKFEPRIPNKHFVINYIPRDYIEPTKEQEEEVLKGIRKIYPNKVDLDTVLFILGSAMTGKATKEQKILFLLGVGANGKSTILNLTNEAVGSYMETLEEDAFSVSNKNADKTFSTFHNRPYIRLIWNNEPKADQMNVTTFKTFCEGQMKGKLLYKNGVHNFNHNAVPIFSANLMPNIKIDGGVVRRFRGYNHTSTFTEDKNKVDEKKHIYFSDRDFVTDMNDGLKNAWVKILCSYGHRWYKGEVIPCPISFQTAKAEMMDVNDNIQDFIDAKLKITTNGIDDRIGKNEMVTLYNQLYPKKHITPQQLISLLKVKNVEYKNDLRCRNTSIKGCFINITKSNGVSSSNVDDVEELEDVEEDNKMVDLQEENDKLKEEILALKQLLESKEDKELSPDEIDELLFG